MMPRIIVKALQKRNETGLEPQIGVWNRMIIKSCVPLNEAFPPIVLYKSTQRERLNLYRFAHTSDAYPASILYGGATSAYENPITGLHPTASRQRRCNRPRCPQRCGILKYCGTKGAHDRTVLLRYLNIVTQRASTDPRQLPSSYI
jgi:hypothetical protein